MYKNSGFEVFQLIHYPNNQIYRASRYPLHSSPNKNDIWSFFLIVVTSMFVMRFVQVNSSDNDRMRNSVGGNVRGGVHGGVRGGVHGGVRGGGHGSGGHGDLRGGKALLPHGPTYYHAQVALYKPQLLDTFISSFG